MANGARGGGTGGACRELLATGLFEAKLGGGGGGGGGAAVVIFPAGSVRKGGGGGPIAVTECFIGHSEVSEEPMLGGGGGVEDEFFIVGDETTLEEVGKGGGGGIEFVGVADEVSPKEGGGARVVDEYDFLNEGDENFPEKEGGGGGAGGTDNNCSLPCREAPGLCTNKECNGSKFE